MNEVANFCELVGADVDMVRRGMGTDSRIGPRFLFPGIGYGRQLLSPRTCRPFTKAEKMPATSSEFLDSVMAVNESQKTILFDPMLAHYGGDLKGVGGPVGTGLQARDRRHPGSAFAVHD